LDSLLLLGSLTFLSHLQHSLQSVDKEDGDEDECDFQLKIDGNLSAAFVVSIAASTYSVLDFGDLQRAASVTWSTTWMRGSTHNGVLTQEVQESMPK
jgi:hypothetical protein